MREARTGLVRPWLEVGIAWWRRKPRPWFVACEVCGGLGAENYENDTTRESRVWIHFCQTRKRVARAVKMHLHCSPCGQPGKRLSVSTH